MTKTLPKKKYRWQYVLSAVFLLPGVFFVYGAVQTELALREYFLASTIVTLTTLVPTVGLAVFCFEGFRSGKKIRNLPLWVKLCGLVGFVFVIIMILGTLDVLYEVANN